MPVYDWASLPPIKVTRVSLAEILAAGSQSRGVFSCNARCEVWPAVKRGHIPPSAREYVDLPALDEIAEAVVKAWPRGGRFRITEEGVLLLGNQEPLFSFEVVD